jgi:hypothetical protein
VDPKARLYGMAYSHPVLAARLMLERAGLEYEAWNILPGLHAPVVRAAGFQTVQLLRASTNGRTLRGECAARPAERSRPPSTHVPPARTADPLGEWL